MAKDLELVGEMEIFSETIGTECDRTYLSEEIIKKPNMMVFRD
ncbi:hypothetical protein [Brunnivagina elsteri]|nr:hypothetical protein [Calothrix elsteri]